jgi:hypothetical protein
MNAAETGPLLVRYEVDPAAERSLAVLRSVAAVVVIAAAALVVAGRRVPIPVFLAALLGLLIGPLWLVQARRARARAHEPERHFLAVHARGLWLCEGKEPRWIPFHELTGVIIDEERLDILLVRPDGEPIRLEPRYPGVAIGDLMATLRNAWLAGRDC